MEKVSFPIPVLENETTMPALGSQDSWHCVPHNRHITNEDICIAGNQISVQGSCPDCEADQQSAERISKQQEEYETRLALRRRMGVPERYLGKSLSDFQENTIAQQRVGEQLRAFVDGGWKSSSGLLFLGNVGTAKTMLGAALVNFWLDHHGKSSARFYTMLGLMRRIKDTWNPESFETQAMALQRLRDLPLLIVDEIGVQFGSSTEGTLFTDLINERYNAVRPTVLITNLTIEGCYELLGERVMDRLRDGGHALAFNWPSWRGTPISENGLAKACSSLPKETGFPISQHAV